jgi:hypothetical protein
MPGARTQNKLPIEIVAGNWQTSSHVCTQPQTHASRPGFKPGTNVGAGCSCHPTGYTIIARLAFLYILSGPKASCTLQGTNPINFLEAHL